MPKQSRRASPVRLPLNSLPKIERAVRALHRADSGTITYCYATTALHLYDYPARVRIGTHAFDLQPGDLTFTPPRTPKRYDVPQDGRHWCVHFHAARRTGLAGTLILPLHIRLADRIAHATEQLRQIVHLAGGPDCDTYDAHLRRAEADCRLQALLLWLAQEREAPVTGRDTRAESGIERVAAHLRDHLHERHTPGALARRAELSRNYLARRFRERYGMTMLRYALECRIGRARELLETTDMPIQSIAAQVGLADLQQFNKSFRRVSGISPSAWRRHTAGRDGGRG